MPRRSNPDDGRLRAGRRRTTTVAVTLMAAVALATALQVPGAGGAPAVRPAAAHPMAKHLPLSRSDRQQLTSLIDDRLHASPIHLLAPRASGAVTRQDASSPSAMPQSGYVYGGAPYGPADLWHMFGTPDAAAAPTYGANLSGVPGPTASSPLVAVLEAGNYPDTYAHLQRFRADQTLPPCPVGSCITTVDQNGGTDLPGDTTNGSWAFETDLDVQVISAVCPQCRILIVAANDSGTPNLVQAAQTAVAMGAGWVSMSFGIGSDSESDVVGGRSVFDNPGVVFTAATGDYGNAGASWPSSSPYVVATGGLSVKTTGSSLTASAWSGAGSGCATDATHQMSAAQSGDSGAVQACGNMRGASDISSIADPSTGVLTYSTVNGKQDYYYGGGTSAAAPAIAALYALAGNSTSASSIYLNQRSGSGDVTDVTSGSNSSGSCASSRVCTAQAGWDGPTGLGFPNNLALFEVAGDNGDQTTTLGALSYVTSPLRLAGHATASDGGIVVSAHIPVTTTQDPGGDGSGGGGSGSSTGGTSGGGLLGGLGSILDPGTTQTHADAASTTTSTTTLENVWFTATGLPAGTALIARAQYNADGTIRAWSTVPSGAPPKVSKGTAVVTIYAAAKGHVVSQQLQLPWRVLGGHWRPATRRLLSGNARRGARLRAVRPTMRTLSNRRVTGIHWTYQWSIDGRPVNGATGSRFTVPTSYAYVGRHTHRVVGRATVRRGSRVTLRLTAEADGYPPERLTQSVRVSG